MCDINPSLYPDELNSVGNDVTNVERMVSGMVVDHDNDLDDVKVQQVVDSKGANNLTGFLNSGVNNFLNRS